MVEATSLLPITMDWRHRYIGYSCRDLRGPGVQYAFGFGVCASGVSVEVES